MKFNALQIRTTARYAVLATFLCVLAACGFHMRGQADLSFHTLYINGASAPTIAADLKRTLKSNGIKIVPLPEQAEMQLELMGEGIEKRILSLSGGGKVREYELLYRANFRTRATGSETWGPTQTVDSRRDYSYDDALLLAKEGEETRLNNDMRADATREIMRRLSAQKFSGKPSAAD
jgi:LPS-assembly lipoprotein